MTISAILSRPLKFPNSLSGPFPPPELPGFPGTTSLSATRCSPAWPSRASGWDLASLRIGFPVLPQSPMCRHAFTITPVGSRVLIVHDEGVSAPRFSPRRRPSPSSWRVGSHVATFEACSVFTTRYGLPTRRTAFRCVCLEGSDGFVTSAAAPIASGWSDQTWPGGTCTHWKTGPYHGAHEPNGNLCRRGAVPERPSAWRLRDLDGGCGAERPGKGAGVEDHGQRESL